MLKDELLRSEHVWVKLKSPILANPYMLDSILMAAAEFEEIGDLLRPGFIVYSLSILKGFKVNIPPQKMNQKCSCLKLYFNIRRNKTTAPSGL